MKTNDNVETQVCLTKGALAALVEYNRNIIRSWLERAARPSAKLQSVGPEYAEIAVSAGGKTNIFGLWFGKILRNGRKLRINPLCLDAFDKDDECQIEKIRVMGFFVDNIADIEKDIIGTYKAKRLYGAWRRAWKAMYGN